jgi:hypothetical protein
MIRAECHSDDRVREASFDATPWFEQASDKEILDLAQCEWGGDYPADYVAHFMAGKNTAVAQMFQYLELVAPKKDAPGFECYITEKDAFAWVKANRPDLASQLIALDL